MADETPPRRPVGPEPASDAKKHAKRVVLSSVAKSAPASASESLLGEPSKVGPPELPPKTSDGGLVRPVGWTIRPGGTTTIIKLPPKTGTLPRLTSLSHKAREETSAPLSPESPANGEESARRTGPIKIAAPLAPAPSEQESIFAAPSPAPEAKASPLVPKAPPAAPVSKSTLTPIEVKAPAALKRALPPPLPPPPVKVVEKKPPVPVVTSPAAPPAKAEPHRVVHVPPLVAHDAPTPEAAADSAPPAAVAPKYDPLAQTARLTPPPPIHRESAQPATQGVLPLPEAPGRDIPAGAPLAEARGLDPLSPKHRLPPRSSATGRLRAAPPTVVSGQKSAAIPPKVFPNATVTPQVVSSNTAAPASAPAKPAPPLTVSAQKPVRSSVTPPTIPLQPGRVKPPTIPLRAAPAAFLPVNKLAPRGGGEAVVDKKKEAVPASRATRQRRRRQVGIVVFYVLLVALLPCLYEGALFFTRETRVEGQVIPPPGMVLGSEVWIVTDFRDLEKGIADDLADDRQIVVQDMQEKLSHVQRAQSDVATREARIRLLKDQIQADNDEQMSLMKQARDASQQIWDGPGAQMEADYQSRLRALNQAIADRARANHLAYSPDPNFYSPEVWANAYRLALYEVPAGVDSVKERTWLDAQMKAWHDFTKAMDQKQADLRQQAAQLKLQPASKVADLKSQIQDLQGRIDATMAEEEPLKGELEQAHNDLAASQAKEAGLDAKPYEKLDALPEQNITKRLPMQSNGRFSWRELEKENKYAADERSHVFWIFARAFRPDGRQYWALNRFSVDKDSTTLLMIEPDSFTSTKAILRPDLSPDEQTR